MYAICPPWRGFMSIERHSIDFVPEHERHGRDCGIGRGL
jgi:hypothetical protein